MQKREAPDENPALFSCARTFLSRCNALCIQHFQIRGFDRGAQRLGVTLFWTAFILANVLFGTIAA